MMYSKIECVIFLCRGLTKQFCNAEFRGRSWNVLKWKPPNHHHILLSLSHCLIMPFCLCQSVSHSAPQHTKIFLWIFVVVSLCGSLCLVAGVCNLYNSVKKEVLNLLCLLLPIKGQDIFSWLSLYIPLRTWREFQHLVNPVGPHPSTSSEFLFSDVWKKSASCGICYVWTLKKY